MSSINSRKVSDLHGKAVIRTYITLAIVFVCMLSINIFAYFTIIDVGQWYSSLENAIIPNDLSSSPGFFPGFIGRLLGTKIRKPIGVC